MTCTGRFGGGGCTGVTGSEIDCPMVFDDVDVNALFGVVGVCRDKD